IRLNAKKIQITFTVLLTLFTFAFTLSVLAEEPLSKLSGLIVTADGRPIRDIEIHLSKVEIDHEKGGTIDLHDSLITQTDLEGRFSFFEISPGLVQLRVQRKPEEHNGVFVSSPSRISVVQFGTMKFYPHSTGFKHLGKVTFSIKPGAEIKNVVITMEKRLILKGKILYKDGSPLAKTSVELEFNWFRMGQTDYYAEKSIRTLFTYAEGNFYHWVSRPGICTIKLKHNGLSAYSEPFLIDKETEVDDIVLRLDGNINDMTKPILEKQAEEEQNRPRYIPDFPAMWIMNPSNGHVYKWIHCKTREDARKQAAEVDAYLVTITSEAEQIWIESAFGNAPYSIGLTDKKKEGKWEWDNGEPVTYTNWKPKGSDPREDDDAPALLKAFGVKGERQKRREEEQDYVIMTGKWGYWDSEIGKWKKTSGTSYIAIIEKDSLTITGKKK
ncbi:hypothetical protein F4001_01275, partial [Candidatus Poribacteria bacterium]|nr:hypothetical protein [Candidatus Poribacteria bacterium]